MTLYTTFEASQFGFSVDKALQRLQTILDTTRQPRLAHEEENHTYDDKFALVEFLTNTAIAAKLNALERLGLDPEKLAVALNWVHNEQQSVTLRFQAEDSCSFLKEKIVRVREERSCEVVETQGCFGKMKNQATTKMRVKTKVREHHWKLGLEYQLLLIKGANTDASQSRQRTSSQTPLKRTGNEDVSSSLCLHQRCCSSILMTSGGQASGGSSVPTNPLPRRTVHPPVDVNLTWLLERISPDDQSCHFFIDRHSENAKASCRTPRRNEDVDEALEFEQHLNDWAQQTREFFLYHLERTVVEKHNPVEFPTESMGGGPQSPSLHQLSTDMLFGPILPLMEKGNILLLQDTAALLREQNRSINHAVIDLAQSYPPSQSAKLISVTEATIVLLCQHIDQLSEQYSDGVTYVEDMLKQQLIHAIGKEVKSKDFDLFMRFHQQKLFDPLYAPRPFAYAIRRPHHYPDGMLSLESTLEDGEVEPVETWVRHVPGGSHRGPIFLPINAATSVELRGDCYLHGWMQHHFGSSTNPQYQVVARARQFSSILLIVGTMGPNNLNAKHAIILQNNDEVLIPLLTETLPTAKEFKEAISSLSPEQQEFATSFRTMQLESSVVGVCVIQLKPQLERLLNLPDGALTKEIQLTQDLLSLFVDYQIPSDLLSFSDGSDHPATNRVKAVKDHAQAVLTMINGEKKKQVEDEVIKLEIPVATKFEKCMSSPSALCLEMPNAQEVLEVEMLEFEMERCMVRVSSGREWSLLPSKLPILARVSRSAPFSLRRGAATSNHSPPAHHPESSSSLSVQSPTQTSSTTVPIQRATDPSVAIQPTHAKLNHSAPDVTSAANKCTFPTDAGSNQVPVLANHTTAADDEQEPEKREPSMEPTPQAVDDYTAIPKLLDSKIEQFDTDNALRSTIIKASPNWIRKRQDSLLTTAAVTPVKMTASDLDTEKKRAFDLLDAISKSGSLPIVSTELHVVIAVSHCFENDVMGTIIEDNINPIAKVERSALLLGSTIHKKSPATLLATDVERLTHLFPELLLQT